MGRTPGPRSADGARPSVALGIAEALAEDFARRAAEVDEAGVFPEENIAQLRDSGLLGMIVPVEYGGMGCALAEFVEVAQLLGGACPSTAMLWAMHCQQVAAVVGHAGPELRRSLLPEIAGKGHLLASVTTEPGKGGHLLTAFAGLAPGADDRLNIERDAPVVSGGLHADGYLITMRSVADGPTNEVALAYLPRAGADIDVRGEWNVLGMRATESVGLRITGTIAEDNLINGRTGFREVAVSTMIPMGHLAWASVWLGAARGALRWVVGLLRDPRTRSGGQLGSDLFLHDLARIRLRLDVLSAYLHSCLSAYESLLADAAGGPARFDDVAFQLQINGLKVAVSEGTFEAVDAMVKITGLRFGYARSPNKPLERVFRDLRSGALMYANERLLIANGKLSLLDRRVRLAGDPAEAGAVPFGALAP